MPEGPGVRERGAGERGAGEQRARSLIAYLESQLTITLNQDALKEKNLPRSYEQYSL